MDFSYFVAMVRLHRIR